MKIIRVFPRRTAATPDDEGVRVGVVPGMFDEADEIRVSVAFEWDKDAAEQLAYQWEHVAPVTVGGPAYGDPGSEFEPGMYVKRGYVITSRGCPNQCWFCRAWQNEGNAVRELEIHDGWNVLDNNLLATSREHQEQVFRMLMNQKERARFTGGFEAAKFTEWTAEWMVRLKPKVMFFAYDEPSDLEPLAEASKILHAAELITASHAVRCYVLVGYRGDTVHAAEERLGRAIALGYMPMAMLFDKDRHRWERDQWIHFQKTWARPMIVGRKMKAWGC